MSEILKKIGYGFIDKSSSDLINIAEFLHNNPELGFNEVKGHDFLCDFLERYNFKVDRHFVYPTGFRAIFQTADGPHVAIPVEYDALPEIGHACGHNIIAESSIALAIGLQEVMRKGLFCKMSVFGTPAEENGGGKIKFIDDGHFKNVDVVIMSHPFKFNYAIPPLVALFGLDVHFDGQEAHAAVDPWNGKNALDAAVLAYQSIACLRQQVSPDCRIHGVITNGGTAPNIIPNHTEMKYYIRAPTSKQLKDLIPRVKDCFIGSATMTRCTVKMNELFPMLESYIYNKTFGDIFTKNALLLGIDLKPTGIEVGSSDIANVSHTCATLQPMFYIGTDASIHTKEFTEATGTKEAYLYGLKQAKVMLGTVVDVFSDDSGVTLRRIKEEFLESK